MGDNQERVGRGKPRSGWLPSWAGRGLSGALGAVLVLLVALALRAPHLDWDQGTAAHPDERAVAFAAERIALAHGKLDPDFFAYGSLPLYLLAGAREAVAAVTGTPADFGRTLLLGRALSVLAALLTIAVAVGAGRRLGGATAGLLAGALLALCPLHLQNSRFATVDVLLTLLASVSVAALARWAEEERRSDLIVAAVAAGLALATKVAALLLIVPALAALWSIGRGRGLRRTLGPAALGLGAALAAFVAAQPMTLVRPARVLRDLAEQSAIVRHAGIVPYTFQYVGSRPFVDPLIDLALWGLGPALALAAALGVGSALRPGGPPRRPATIVWVAWALGFFLCLGGLETQFPRYLLPIYPALLVLAAVPLARWVRSPVRWRRVTLGLLLAVAAAQAIAVSSIAYRPTPSSRPRPGSDRRSRRVAASCFPTGTRACRWTPTLPARARSSTRRSTSTTARTTGRSSSVSRRRWGAPTTSSSRRAGSTARSRACPTGCPSPRPSCACSSSAAPGSCSSARSPRGRACSGSSCPTSSATSR